ncbi:MAG: ElyC/SanA/YdcF family protein [Patescibacteria group bacterium]
MSEFGTPTPPEAHEVKLPYQKVDLTILLGKNWDNKKDIPELTEETEVFLSRDSAMTAIAGGHLYVEGLTDELLSSTGVTKENYPAEAEAMDLTIGSIFTEEEVPQAARNKEVISIDTEGNAKEVGQMLNNRNFEGTTRLVTVKHHLPRAVALFEEQGIHIDEAVASEDVLKHYGYDTSRPVVTTIKNYGLEFGIRQIRRMPYGDTLIRKVTSIKRK